MGKGNKLLSPIDLIYLCRSKLHKEGFVSYFDIRNRKTNSVYLRRTDFPLKIRISDHKANKTASEDVAVSVVFENPAKSKDLDKILPSVLETYWKKRGGRKTSDT